MTTIADQLTRSKIKLFIVIKIRLCEDWLPVQQIGSGRATIGIVEKKIIQFVWRYLIFTDPTLKRVGHPEQQTMPLQGDPSPGCSSG